tara:strand:- start:2522 stop:2665 length:144 start_codon:yes stop_codon:yes gene_type:complete
MATKTENVEINKDLYEEFIKKISTVDDSEKQEELVKEYYNKIYTIRD